MLLARPPTPLCLFCPLVVLLPLGAAAECDGVANDETGCCSGDRAVNGRVEAAAGPVGWKECSSCGASSFASKSWSCRMNPAFGLTFIRPARATASAALKNPSIFYESARIGEK